MTSAGDGDRFAAPRARVVVAALRVLAPSALVPLGLVAAQPTGAVLWVAAVALVLAPACRAPRRGLWIAPLLFLAVGWATLTAAQVPQPFPAAVLATALLAAGAALAARGPAVARAALPFVAGLAVLLAALPDLFGAAPAAWARVDGGAGARLLDLSPATWFVEAAGIDWMRHPSVYAPAGTDWFSDARAPFDGTVLAAVASLVAAILVATGPARVATDRVSIALPPKRGTG